jgi:tRNA A-37 threonylcarbamoyl transferase component Bud32
MAVYIIMQNIAHGASKLQSLFEYVKAGNPYPEKKIRILMARMRKAGVLHGDLHAENILVKTFTGSRYFRVYFIDYGRSIYVPANRNVRTHLIQKGYMNMTENKFPGYFESPTSGVPRSVNQTILNRNARALKFNRTKLRR